MTTVVLHLRSTVPGHEGQWYKKTAQYGYWGPQEYIDNIKCPVFWKAHRGGVGRDSTAYKDMYACGFLPPHYPVPAIPVEAIIHSDCIVITKRTIHGWIHIHSWFPRMDRYRVIDMDTYTYIDRDDLSDGHPIYSVPRYIIPRVKWNAPITYMMVQLSCDDDGDWYRYAMPYYSYVVYPHE